MAKQKGIIKLKGTIGDITFYKSKDGFIAREKTTIDAKRIATDPAFQRTRENGAEFGRAGKASKVLRNAFRPVFKNSADSRMTSRLTQAMMKVVQADLVSVRGKRNVIDGEAALLQGFEFNGGAKLETTLFAPYLPTIDRTAGEISLRVPSFVPADMLAAPAGTTHFRIYSAGAEIDFEQEAFRMESSESTIMSWDTTQTMEVVQVNQVTADSTWPLFLVVVVEFYQMVNAQLYPLKNGSYNPLSLVKVDGGA
ncbi:hypothetical protein [Flavobacterium soli]|uniref:hypothetical protein n=1 Tax=Flavobacterium soli TaxID=344881 RepID=UPI0003FE505B|nr:hypothetical protein [Flavobacterium soli]